MTRDRPAAGAQDSTLEGEFPGDLGGGRASPLDANVLSDTFLPNFLDNSEGDFESNIAYPSNENILAMNNGAVGGTLSGVYRFNTSGRMFQANSQSVSTSATVTGGGTSINMGSIQISQGMAGDFAAGLSITPTTGTVNTMYLAGIGFDISAEHFNSYVTRNVPGYTFNAAGVQFNSPGELSLTAGSGMVTSFRAPPAPAYIYRYQTTGITTDAINRIQSVPFVPNSSTTISPHAIIYGMSPGATVTADFFMTVRELEQPSPDATFKSSL